MGRTPLQLRTAIAVMAVVLVASSAPAGATAPASTVPPTTTTLPTRSPTVAMAKAVAVGAATVRAFYGYNTLTDTSTWDAVLRSAAYYTPVYAALTRSVHPQQTNDPQWDEKYVVRSKGPAPVLYLLGDAKKKETVEALMALPQVRFLASKGDTLRLFQSHLGVKDSTVAELQGILDLLIRLNY